MFAIISSPSKYVQGKGELKNVSAYTSLLSKRGVYAVVDSFIYDKYQTYISHSFLMSGEKLVLGKLGGECSMSEIQSGTSPGY